MLEIPDYDPNATIVEELDAEGRPPLSTVRHSASHVMAAAVKRLFPDAHLGVGPAIEDGFYYDIEMARPFTPEDLEAIEGEMAKIIKADEPFVKKMWPVDEAIALFLKTGERFKVEIIEDLKKIGVTEVSSFENGDFLDLCRGPHVRSTRQIGAYKLLSIAGAYWRGNERNPQLQRIYGTAWHSKKELADYLHRLAEAEKRDHRKLGRQLDLFSVHEEVGAGLVFWHPKLGMVRHLIETYWREEHLKRGYEFVYTPHIASERIYVTSGHLENYADLMYSAMDIDGSPYRVKPMNCPGHIKIFQTRQHSYRTLPRRFAELGTVYRYERSGVLHGMLRVRGFTVDDTHIFCTHEQLADEVTGILELIGTMMRDFGFTWEAYLATRPKDKSLGTDEEWTWATEALREALERRGLAYQVDEGGGAFYAPKIDVKLYDALGRGWQGPTIQVDLNLPKRFGVTYIGQDGKEHEVAIVHRAILGSLERFVGGLIEHYAGEFPLWLAPAQVRVLSVSEASAPYAQHVRDALRLEGLRAEADLGPDKIGAKIRLAETEKTPWMLVVGERDVEAQTVSPRRHKGKPEAATFLAEFVRRAKEEVAAKRRLDAPPEPAS
ncbi:MAG: threonine--tRNA ligase [Candidatus Eiseniibacteriota bacterium]